MATPAPPLAHRNEVVALRIVDGADDALPEAGLIVVEDAETGEQILLDSADPWFRTRFRDGVDEREAGLRSGMRRAGVPLHRVDTGSDLIEVLLAVIAETRWRAWMSLSYPPLLILGLLVAAALIVGAVLAGRRRSAALAAAGVSVSSQRNNQLGLWLSSPGSCCWLLRWPVRPLRCRSAEVPARSSWRWTCPTA